MLDTPYILDPNGSDPVGEQHALRARGPITRVDLLGELAWAVTSPNLLDELLRSDEVSKDPREHWPRFEAAKKTWPLFMYVADVSMFTAYGADHRRLRNLVAPAFKPAAIAALQSNVERLVDELLDDLDDVEPGAVVELRDRLAYPLPIRVISHLLGLTGDTSQLQRLVNAGFDTSASQAEAAVIGRRLYALLDDLIATKRATPGEDLTSLLIAADAKEDEIRGTLLLMISAGYETTANVLGQGITALLRDRSQLEHVRAGRAAWAEVTEEILRAEPALRYMPLRYAVNDIPLPDGQGVIRKGDAILAAYAAANRSPEWHDDDPDIIDVTRSTAARHMAFGRGAHYCLGAPLARLEVTTALERFFTRFPQAQLAVPAEELQRVPSLLVNGPASVPVRLHTV